MKSKEKKIKEQCSILLVAGGGRKESVHTVYRQSGGHCHCAKIGRPKGGFERADFVLCGMEVLGSLVESEGSLCLFCPPLPPSFCSFLNDEQLLQEGNS